MKCSVKEAAEMVEAAEMAEAAEVVMEKAVVGLGLEEGLDEAEAESEEGERAVVEMEAVGLESDVKVEVTGVGTRVEVAMGAVETVEVDLDREAAKVEVIEVVYSAV